MVQKQLSVHEERRIVVDEPAQKKLQCVERVVENNRAFWKRVAQLPSQHVVDDEKAEGNKQKRRQPPNNRVSKQIAASHGVSEPENGVYGLDRLLRFSRNRLVFNDLDNKVVVRVAFKALVPVARGLVLPINLRNRWSDIVRVQSSVCQQMLQSDLGSVGQRLESCWLLGSIVQLNKPLVVVVKVWVQRDLLLPRASFLDGTADAHPRNSKEADPFGGRGKAQTDAGQHQRFPPVESEWSFNVELGAGVGGGGNEEEQRRVEQNKTRDGGIRTLEHQQRRRQERNQWLAAGGPESQVHEDHRADAQQGAHLSHENIRHVVGELVADFGKFKLAIKSPKGTHRRK
ncbi:hypothetical protein OGATHE_004075 [Ogataea polymorpha]|uniref:Uncharacterized protein n=1 Tax=Ogataea polymorpha TaxID=460523 RepID=A0A9P8P572_9ASCO|nr:hypothetical protein OGATHE_004075 [Ogataea polymorpha]